MALNSSAVLLPNEHGFTIAGALDFTTVTSLWKASLPLLAPQKEIKINLEKVTAANSAGLVLLLEWLKYAERAQKKINFINVPPHLMSVAAVVDIDGLLK